MTDTALDNPVEKATRRLAAFDGKIYEAFDDLGTGVSARQLQGWFDERLQGRPPDTVGKAYGAALAIAMIAVDADRRTRATVAVEYAETDWRRDPEWEKRLSREQLAAGLVGDLQAWRRTPMQAIIGRELPTPESTEPRWHVSVAHMERIPTWEELVDAAHALRPGVPFSLGLPPRSWWLNYDERVLHLWETRDLELIESWRLAARSDRPT